MSDHPSTPSRNSGRLLMRLAGAAALAALAASQAARAAPSWVFTNITDTRVYDGFEGFPSISDAGKVAFHWYDGSGPSRPEGINVAAGGLAAVYVDNRQPEPTLFGGIRVGDIMGSPSIRGDQVVFFAGAQGSPARIGAGGGLIQDAALIANSTFLFLSNGAVQTGMFDFVRDLRVLAVRDQSVATTSGFDASVGAVVPLPAPVTLTGLPGINGDAPAFGEGSVAFGAAMSGGSSEQGIFVSSLPGAGSFYGATSLILAPVGRTIDQAFDPTVSTAGGAEIGYGVNLTSGERGIVYRGQFVQSNAPFGTGIVNAIGEQPPNCPDHLVGTGIGNSGAGLGYRVCGGDDEGTRVPAGGAFGQFLGAGIDASGRVLFNATLAAGGTGVFSGADALADKVIATGDPLFGSTVTAVRMGTQAVNARGDLALVAYLADGRTAIVRAQEVELPRGGLTVLADGRRRAQFVLNIGSSDSPGAPDRDMVRIDPPVAVGFEYEVNAGPRFARFALPDLGDPSYELHLYDAGAGAWYFHSALAPLTTFDFTAIDPLGVSRFRVMGIAESLFLGPDDPLAFPTEVGFMGIGEVDMTMTSIVVNVTPVPGTALLLAAGLLLLRGRAPGRRGSLAA